MKCDICGNKDIHKTIDNPIEIFFVCDCGTLYRKEVKYINGYRRKKRIY